MLGMLLGGTAAGVGAVADDGEGAELLVAAVVGAVGESGAGAGLAPPATPILVK